VFRATPCFELFPGNAKILPGLGNCEAGHPDLFFSPGEAQAALGELEDGLVLEKLAASCARAS